MRGNYSCGVSSGLHQGHHAVTEEVWLTSELELREGAVTVFCGINSLV